MSSQARLQWRSEQVSSEQIEVVVAGHICLDIIPTFQPRTTGSAEFLVPGTLVTVGPAHLSTGGPVSNTGLALHRLGVPTRLMGKVGADLFGEAVLNLLRAHDPRLAAGMIVDEHESTSYSIVISPPGVDRTFLHSPGANDTFRAADVDVRRVAGARLFHFGYPPLMREMYQHDGADLARLMRRVKDAGLTTSLDMAYPDPETEAGRADWARILEETLPYVDVFLPSLDELLLMLERETFDGLHAGEPVAAQIDGGALSRLAGRVLGMGAAVVGLKLGDQGLYLRTTDQPERLAAMGASAPRDVSSWCGRELLVPCFATEVVGTTGAGDATIAGFIAALLKGLPIEQTLTMAVAVGAFNVERADATSGIPDWATVEARVQTGWARRPVDIVLPGWRWDEPAGVWVGPNDRVRTAEEAYWAGGNE